MIEVMQFYVSGFWIWLGLTIGLGIVAQAAVAIIVGSFAALRGRDVRIE